MIVKVVYSPVLNSRQWWSWTHNSNGSIIGEQYCRDDFPSNLMDDGNTGSQSKSTGQLQDVAFNLSLTHPTLGTAERS